MSLSKKFNNERINITNHWCGRKKPRHTVQALYFEITQGTKMKQLFILLILLLLSGCALIAPKGDFYSESTIPQIKEEAPLVYFYRVGNQNASKHGMVNIYANDVKIFKVIDKCYTWFYLEPGEYTFKAEWSWDEKPLFEAGLYDTKKLTLNIKPGEVYYLNYRVNEVGKSSYDEFGLYGKMLEPRSKEASVEIVQEDKFTATNNLHKCRYQRNSIMKE